MLNCTDLECILHHHHYYAQLHHLTYGTHVEDAASTEPDGVNDIQVNDTDSEISNLSHLDAPNDNLIMIGGVVIAMFLVAAIIVILAAVISKLRKREEHSNSVHPADVVLQTSPAPPPAAHNLHNNHLNNNHNNHLNNNHNHHLGGATTITTTAATTTTAPSNAIVNPSNNDLSYRGQFLWQTPPPSTQQHLYNNNQDALVQSLPTERTGFVRGFRKNLGGRWRRLVKRKPETEVYTIPAELKPQLKQIYVY